jgi:transitional endoplasmic reticulum ATPase
VEPTETFECAGCAVTMVDMAGALSAASADRVNLLQPANFPPPVRQVRFSVRADAAGHHFEAEIRTGLAVLGNDPIGVLLGRRLAAGDPWATRLVDGVGTAVAKAYRTLGLAQPEQTSVRESHGIQATVHHGGSPSNESRTITVRATVPSDEVAPAHVRAMFCVVLDVVTDLGGDVTGREYVLRHQPVDGSDTTLDQVGGLDAVVAQFRQIAVSFKHPEVMARWGARRPQGILLYGPPGTGKTMLARALAHEIGATFREVRTPEILDKWLGASERNIKRIFRDARRYREPTVMLFDEFDSIISYTGGGMDAAGQAINAVAGIFKQEMNNLIEENPNVIVVATTNFPHRVDESLIRSGRFDVKLEIPVPDAAGRAQIFGKMIRELSVRHDGPDFRMFAGDLAIDELAAASPGLTGADIREVLRRVRLDKAMEEARSGTRAVPIGQADLIACLGSVASPG